MEAAVLFWVAAYGLLSAALWLANPDIFPAALLAGGGLRASFWGLFHLAGGGPLTSWAVFVILAALSLLPLVAHSAGQGWRVFVATHTVIAALLAAGGLSYAIQL